MEEPDLLIRYCNIDLLQCLFAKKIFERQSPFMEKTLIEIEKLGSYSER